MSQDLTLITLDPGHFHAALFQREMLPGIADEAFVYAPLGPDLTAHLNRVSQFNLRADHPTRWRLRVYAAPDYEEVLLRNPPGQIVVMSGRNRGKIGLILDCVDAGLHVLADKPWIIEPGDLPKLEAALDAADARHVIAYDAMTQRFEITAILQRAFVNDPDIFGQPITGSPSQPAVILESLHYLLKEVSGAVNLRPPWFFDIAEQGEGLCDVGTHLVDMVTWVLFPETAWSIPCRALLKTVRPGRILLQSPVRS
jgi:predicted dehydrogenase